MISMYMKIETMTHVGTQMIVEALNQIPHVDAHAVASDWDIVAKISADTMGEICETKDNIRKKPDIRKTLSYVVAEGVQTPPKPKKNGMCVGFVMMKAQNPKHTVEALNRIPYVEACEVFGEQDVVAEINATKENFPGVRSTIVSLPNVSNMETLLPVYPSTPEETEG